jgi:hypothetical protein
MLLGVDQQERRTELWMGTCAGLISYCLNLAGAWWFLDSFHYGPQQLLGMPLLALWLALIEGFALRRVSDRAATAFVCAGFCAAAVAALLINSLEVAS